MTAFSTRCLRSARHSLWGLLAALALLAGLPLPTRAEGPAVEVTQLRVDRAEDGLFLTAQIKLELPTIMEDALNKGVALFFVAEAELLRDRWYWYDRKLSVATKYMRLAYQPLTRRWRLNVASGVITANSMGMTLNQSFDTLDEAMTAVRRLSGWKVADASVLDSGSTHKVEVRFALDLAQLPRPFQIGAFGQSDWTISASATQQISPEGSR
jgi:hypothetical protein